MDARVRGSSDSSESSDGKAVSAQAAFEEVFAPHRYSKGLVRCAKRKWKRGTPEVQARHCGCSLYSVLKVDWSLV